MSWGAFAMSLTLVKAWPDKKLFNKIAREADERE